MQSYEDVLTDIRNTLGTVPHFFKELPRDFLVNEWPIFKNYIVEDGMEIPRKYRALIGLALGGSLRCDYTKTAHRELVNALDVTDEELSELSFITSFVTRWSSLMHTLDYDFDDFVNDWGQIVGHLEAQEKVEVTT